MPYLTLSAVAGEQTCRRFFIPNNMLAYFMGALYELTLPYRYEESGSLTPDEMAEAFREIIDNYEEGCMIGVIFPYLTEDTPSGSLAMDGTTYPGASYPELFDRLDPAFKDGENFTLPDLSGRTIVGAGAGAGLSVRNVGDSFGDETVSLTIAQMPAHDHSYTKAIFPETPVLAPGEFPVLAGELLQPTGTTGSGNAHPNMQPSIALKYAVWYR